MQEIPIRSGYKYRVVGGPPKTKVDLSKVNDKRVQHKVPIINSCRGVSPPKVKDKWFINGRWEWQNKEAVGVVDCSGKKGELPRMDISLRKAQGNNKPVGNINIDRASRMVIKKGNEGHSRVKRIPRNAKYLTVPGKNVSCEIEKYKDVTKKQKNKRAMAIERMKVKHAKRVAACS